MTIYQGSASTQTRLAAAVANGGSVVVPYIGSARAAFGPMDATTMSVAINDNDVYGASLFTATFGASGITVVNNSGVAWPAGASITVSAKIPRNPVSAMPQAEYDALATKDASTVYVTV